MRPNEMRKALETSIRLGGFTVPFDISYLNTKASLAPDNKVLDKTASSLGNDGEINSGSLDSTSVGLIFECGWKSWPALNTYHWRSSTYNWCDSGRTMLPWEYMMAIIEKTNEP
jgi:hypothetical protein